MPRRLLLAAAVLCSVAAAPPMRKAPALPLPGVVARSIGPATMGGRVTAVAVVEGKPAVQYVGAASGGLWKTTDDGLSWQCVFDGRPLASVGAVAVAPSDPEVVYLGTGEANARNSVSWGNGVFVSRDGGKTWRHAGLAQTHHIGKIVVHPKDADVAYVAALGRLWGANPERGVFRTRDGGKSWEHVLELDADTGCVDLAIDPGDPRTLYAAAYRVRRDAFSGGNPVTQFGPKAGLYRTRDGGKSWKRLTAGLPDRPIGRCGLEVWRKDPRVLFAVVQTDFTDTRLVPGQRPGLGPVATGGLFRSRDRGETWVKVNDLCPRPFYFGQVRVDPGDENRLWVLGVPLYVSGDGGRTFSSQGARGVHVDHHDLWVNPKDSRHLILGNDGGLYYSRDRGQSWTHAQNLPISQFYGIGLDMQTPYRIYGGLQDNGSWGGPSRTNNPAGILNADWRRVLGMDGFHCQVPPDDPSTVFAEGQYGRLFRVDLRRRTQTSIKPALPRGEVARFNWNAPLLLSPHDSRTLYHGGNVLFKSTDRGASWQAISDDLTRGRAGVRYASTGHTLTAIAESPLKPGLIYVGSDDGRIHVQRDGKTWADLSERIPNLPGDRWVSRLECSPHAEGTVFLAVNRYRNDDRAPYLYRSDDHGKTWKSIAGDLPAGGPLHVVRADPRNKELLYAGSEFGLYVSLNAGKSWQRLGEGLPAVPVHDVAVHPKARELVVATHGRGIYVLDAMPLQELTAKGEARLFEVRPAVLKKLKAVEPPSARTYAGTNPPDGAVIHYLLRDNAPATLEIVSSDGKRVAKLAAASGPGLHRAVWDLRAAAGKAQVPARPGEYTARLAANGKSVEVKFRVLAE